MNQFLAILLFPSMFTFISLSLSTSSFFNNLFIMSSPTHSLRTRSLQALLKHRGKFLNFFPHRLHQLLRILKKRKSSILANHFLQVRVCHLNVPLPYQTQWHHQPLLKYLNKRVLKLNATVKKLWVERKPSKLENEEVKHRKGLFRRARPISTCIRSLQIR